MLHFIRRIPAINVTGTENSSFHSIWMEIPNYFHLVPVFLGIQNGFPIQKLYV